MRSCGNEITEYTGVWCESGDTAGTRSLRNVLRTRLAHRAIWRHDGADGVGSAFSMDARLITPCGAIRFAKRTAKVCLAIVSLRKESTSRHSHMTASEALRIDARGSSAIASDDADDDNQRNDELRPCHAPLGASGRGVARGSRQWWQTNALVEGRPPEQLMESATVRRAKSIRKAP